MNLRILILLLTTAATGNAQTYVVDANNGAGANFTSIDAAVAAVPDGAVLLVQPGSYAPFAITGKGLTVLGQPGVVVTGAPFQRTDITITGTATHQTVVVRDIVLRSSFGGPLQLDVRSCRGPVFLQRTTLDVGPYPGSERGLSLQDCAQVLLEACGPFQKAPGPAGVLAIDLQRSEATLLGCHVLFTHGGGLRALNTNLRLVDCTIDATQPAIEVTSATVQIAGNSRVTASYLGQGIAFGGRGLIRRDPGVPVTGSIAFGVTVLTAPQPLVRNSGGALGTTANAALHGPAGHFGILCLGVPSPPRWLQGITHTAWLGPGLVAGPTGLFGPPITAQVAVPADPRLLGALFGWQGVTLTPTLDIVLTNPVLFAP